MSKLPQTRLAQSPLLVLAAALGAGILLGKYVAVDSRGVNIIGALALGLLLLCFHAVRRHAFRWAVAIMITTSVLTGLALFAVDNRIVAPNRIQRLLDSGALASNEPVELLGTIWQQPEISSDGFYLTVKVQAIAVKRTEQSASGMVLLFAHASEAEVSSEYQKLELRHGARIQVMTALDRDDKYRNPGVLPFTEYLERKGYDATGVIKSPLLIERLEDERVFLPLASIYEWRQSLQNRFRLIFSAETAGVLDAALLGNHYNISRNAAERFRAGGTFHVLVISGLQIAFIGGLALAVTRFFTRRKALQFVAAAGFLWAYTLAVGADASVTRSAFMFTVMVLGPVISRRANTLNNLGAAAIVLLVWHPNDLFDPSFQLTFLSVLSIVTVGLPIMTRMQQVGSWRPTHETPYPPFCPAWFRVLSEVLFWSERSWREEMTGSNIRYRLFKTPWATTFERWRLQRVLRFAIGAVVISGSVQIGMLPLLIIYFHRISFAALILNIFVGVLMAALALIALAATFVSLLNGAAATPLVITAEKINWLMIHLGDPLSRTGIASMRLPHYRGGMAMVYVCYFVLLVLLAFALALWNPMRLDGIPTANQSSLRPQTVAMTATLFVLVTLIVIVHPFSAARPDGNFHVDFLDVGQGDCALVTMPDGTTLLIDGGGRPNLDWKRPDDPETDTPFQRDSRSIGERVVSEFLWARGLDRIDYILATHADADHIDGLNDIARNFKVRGGLVARTPSDDAEYSRFAATMKETQVPIEKIGSGDVLRFGDVSADVFWPPASNDTSAPSRNDDSLVLRFRHGGRFVLFTGDVESRAELRMLTQGTDLHADIVKVAHHGSRTSSKAAFVAATTPSLAIISVGRTSIFGHPHKEIIERWRDGGAQVMTTGGCGTISIETDGSRLSVSTFVRK